MADAAKGIGETAMTHTLSGGCQCGRVRYVAELENFDAYLCHCRMCQRATGGVAATFVNLRKDRRHWEHDPDWYSSSAIGQRAYCRECGTPLGFEYPDAENCDLTVGSFDDPSHFVPTSHFGVEAMHAVWLDTRGLPETRCDQYESLVQRWAKSGEDMPI
jgi:hypothetical protein